MADRAPTPQAPKDRPPPDGATAPRQRLWRVTRAAAATPLLSLLVLVVAVAGLELGARLPGVRAHLLPPSVDSPSRPAEQQLARLDDFAAAHGRIDCVFLGSSLVLTGIDPDAFADAFERATGRHVGCFNLAVPGATARDAAVLARLVAEDYRPWLVVYGTTYRDFSAQEEGPQLASLPWLAYRNGTFSLDGWITAHSSAYRYFLTYRHVVDAEQWAYMHHTLDSAPNGYWPRARAAVDLAAMVDAGRRTLAERVTEIDDGQLAAVDVFGALRTAGVQVLALELPGPYALSTWLAETPTYQTFRDRIRSTLQTAGVPYWETWRTVPPDLIGDDGWLDMVHLNTVGATLLSRWLGEQVAAAVNRGELRPPPS